MKYAVTSQEMKIYDRNTSEVYGVDSAVLMERAALLIADCTEKYIREKSCNRKYRVLILAGVGNNGGDGACAARLLKQRGFIVSLCVIGDMTKCSDALLAQLKICSRYGIVPDTFSNIRDNRNASEWDVIIDAMLGIGLSRNVTGMYGEAIDYIAACKEERGGDVYVLSVDIPSGVSADNGSICGKAVKADMTVTFNQIKLGHILYPGCEFIGRLFVGDAGITDESFCGKMPGAFFYDEEPSALLPERKKDSNKGTNGKVLIIAGSRNISGACILSASACIHSGAGMVKVFTSGENSETVKQVIPEALIDTYDDYDTLEDRLIQSFDWADSVVLGPGIGQDDVAGEILRIVLKNCKKNLVMDADALNLVSADTELEKELSQYAINGKRLVLTPHLAEFARLYKAPVSECRDNILKYPKELAKKLNCTVVCKDARTIVSDSNEKKIYINVSGNDGMATAGSGDVLAGIVGALICRFESSFNAACVGAYIHGMAGDRASQKHGRYAMVASDIVTELEDILR